MSDWNVERLQINSRVRSVLVSHCVDLGRLSFHTYPGKLSIRGQLVKLQGVAGTFTPELVEQLMEELGEIRKVRRVIANLDNWRQEGSADEWVDASMSTDNRNRDPAATHGSLYSFREGMGSTYTYRQGQQGSP